MKININSNFYKLSDLKFGDLFLYNNHIHMLVRTLVRETTETLKTHVKMSSNVINVICLQPYEEIFISLDTIIMPVQSLNVII